MANDSNRLWNLEAFLDSLILELDKAQDTLSVKGVNRKLTYTVKDLSLDLQVFPQFDGENVRFVTARPGEEGASQISLQLGSIRDNQIREITRTPTQDDLALETIEIPEPERRELKKLGINSAEDLRRAVVDRNVNIEQLTEHKVNYQNLADIINQSRRKQQPPKVSRVSLSRSESLLTLEGSNLALSSAFEQFPTAVLNNEPLPVVAATEGQLQLQIREDQLQTASNQLQVALDPYAIITLEIKGGARHDRQPLARTPATIK